MVKDAAYLPDFKDQIASLPVDHRPNPPQDPDGNYIGASLGPTSFQVGTVEPLLAETNSKSIILGQGFSGSISSPFTRASVEDHPSPSATAGTPIPIAFTVTNADAAENLTGNMNSRSNNDNCGANAMMQNNCDLRQTRCAFAWASFTLIAIAGVVVGGICGSGGCGSDSDEIATFAHAQNITNFINSNTYMGVYLSPTGSSPEERALKWLINDDSLQLNVGVEYDEFRLLQRYSLLTLWFQGVTGTAWLDSTNWLNEDECTWAGIDCELRVVTKVNLAGIGLQGTLSFDLALLSNLALLDLNFNNLSGSLPSEIDLWTSLTYFNIANNSLRGSLPSEIGLWTSLEALIFAFNSFTGFLPSETGLLTSLTDFDVSNNILTGTIPETIANWPLIDNAFFDNNNFAGSMPDGICEFISNSDELGADSQLPCNCCTWNT